MDIKRVGDLQCSAISSRYFYIGSDNQKTRPIIKLQQKLQQLGNTKPLLISKQVTHEKLFIKIKIR